MRRNNEHQPLAEVRKILDYILNVAIFEVALFAEYHGLIKLILHAVF